MKKIIGTVLSVFALLLIFALHTSAEEKSVFVIDQTESTYRFLKNGTVSAESDSLDRLLDGLSALGVPIYMENIEAQESLTLDNGSYTLSGSLSVGGVRIAEGASLTLDDCTLIADGGVSVSGGSLTVGTGLVDCGAAAVTMDYSSLSVLELCGGELRSSSSTPTLIIKNGNAFLKGGRVSNDKGAAIEAYTGLRLGACKVCGLDYDVVAYSPIWATAGESALDSELRVRYMSSFEEGTSTKAVLSASAEQASLVTLKDKDGREYGLTAIGSDLYVYLPYTVKFIYNGSVIGSKEYLAIDSLAPPDFSAPEGYRLLGWCTDVQKKELYDFAGAPTGNLTLYAWCELEQPIYELNGLEVTYTGEEFSLKLDSLTHKLSGIYTYEWYDSEGRVVSTMDHLSVVSVEDSGSYKCKLTFTHETDSIAFETPFVSVTVKPKIIPVPTVESVEYNGLPRYPRIDGSGFLYTEVSFVNVGEYTITLELQDPVNTRWASSDERFARVSFEITKATNRFLEDLLINSTYFGAEIATSARAQFGEPVVLYASSPDGTFSEDVPTAVGKYYARAIVLETANYGYCESTTVSFEILEDVVTCFTVRAYPIKSVYRSFELFEPEGLSFDVKYASGRNELVTASEVAFSYLSHDSFRISHGAIIATYQGHTCLLPITVIPADYTFDISFDNAAVTFDGTYHSLTLDAPLPVGIDGIALEYTIEGGGSNVGSYSVTLKFHTDSVEYNAPVPITATLEILPRAVTVDWQTLSFVYDGSPKCPVAVYRDINGVSVPLSVSGAASLAGEGYVAAASCADPNYTLVGSTATYSILKADYDMSGVYWSSDSFVYSGEKYSVTVHGLPEGVSVAGYTNSSAVEAGGYLATAVLSYDAQNYNPIDNPTHAFVIERAEYDLSCFDFLGGEYVYDGLLHYPLLRGELPVGADGVALCYSFGAGVLNCFDEPSVTVSFYTESKNYNPPAAVTVSVRILPKGIYVDWSDTELVYNGTPQAPLPSCSECIVYSLGGYTDVGVYTASAQTDNSNFLILNPTVEYRISPAPNAWVEQPSVSDVFFGTDPDPVASAMFGTVIYEFYSDPELCSLVSLPLPSGKFYMVARADAGKNYKTLVSSPIPFSVIPITPVSLSVSGRTDYVAFERIGDGDLTVSLINNDGSEMKLSLSDVEIIYPSGDALRALDGSVTLRYGDITADYPLSVGRAEYDMSSLSWSGLSVTYDGNSHCPTLSGLPYGVEVTEYLGGGVTDAGEYPIRAVLSYDEHNYNAPTEPCATLCILQKGVIPECVGAVYNGAPQAPSAANGLYITEDVRYTDAGVYSVKCYLTDDENYYFITDSAYFVISPAVVSVTVKDADVYWFDGPSGFELAFTSGFTATAEELALEFYTEGEQVLVRSDNPNYRLDVTAGRLVRHNRFSPKVTRALFICFLLFVLLASGIVIIVIRRADFVDMYYRLFTRRAVVSTAGGAEYTGAEYMSIDVDRADELITDGIAKTLIRKEEETVRTEGTKRYVVNVDTLSDGFIPGERVDINVLKARGILPADAGYVKVLGRGSINKPLRVYANAFSLSAVKMIALTGGEVYRVKNK